jgi:hypothetical protein
MQAGGEVRLPESFGGTGSAKGLVADQADQ